MLFQCPCNRLIQIPTSYFITMSTSDITNLCIGDDTSCVHMDDPFFGSNMHKNSEEKEETEPEHNLLDDINYQEQEEDESAEMNDD